MKISLNWLKEYIDISFSPEETAEALTAIGLEAEGLEESESIRGGLAGLVIGEVLSTAQHPNADRLRLTQVNIGAEAPLAIVCGAPNVAPGQKVVVATVGTTLYDAEGKAFQIKKSKVRGEDSEGMICAEDEIGLGHSHEGILVLDPAARVGMPAAEFFGVDSDFIIEIGLTPNRSDATCHMGVARDLNAYMQINKGSHSPVRFPDVSAFRVEEHSLDIPVEVRDAQLAPRYCGVAISGIEVKESPDWLKRRLQAIGQRPVNNIVDITNFVHHELGQPLHAFDADQIRGGIVVGTMPEGSLFKTLDEVERKLNGQEIMIADSQGNGLCMAGVFGGAGSGVSEKTSRIFLESAHFHPIATRKAASYHNLRTDSARTFEKGSDPNICIYALKRAALLIQELAGGKISSDIVDLYPQVVEPARIRLSQAQLTSLLGVDIDAGEVTRILRALGMDILESDAEAWTVAVPTNKADVLRPVDLIEEILRIYGFDRVATSGMLRSSLNASENPDRFALKNRAADWLTAKGFCEMMALSIGHRSHYTELLPREENTLVRINNTSNVLLDTMRADMLPSALEAVAHNLNRQQSSIRLYEFGRSYLKAEDGFKEQERLSITLSGPRHGESWIQAPTEADFYLLKSLVLQLLQVMGAKGYTLRESGDDRLAFGLELSRGPQILGHIGAVKSAILKKMGIKQAVVYADLDWDLLVKMTSSNRVVFKEPGRFPSTRRDLALLVDEQISFDAIEQIARKTDKKLLREVNLFDVYRHEQQLGAGKKSYAISLVFEDPEKTLSDTYVDQLMQKLIQRLEQELGAQIRK